MSSRVRRAVAGVLVVGALFASWWTFRYLSDKVTEIKQTQEAAARHHQQRHQRIQDSIAQFASGYNAVLDWEKEFAVHLEMPPELRDQLAHGTYPLKDVGRWVESNSDVVRLTRALVRPDGRPIAFVNPGPADVIQVPGENSHLCVFKTVLTGEAKPEEGKKSPSTLELILSCDPSLVKAAEDLDKNAQSEFDKALLDSSSKITPSPFGERLVAARITHVESKSGDESLRATGFCLGYAYVQEESPLEYYMQFQGIEPPDKTPSVLDSLVADLWGQPVFKVSTIIVLLIALLIAALYVVYVVAIKKPKWLGYPDPAGYWGRFFSVCGILVLFVLGIYALGGCLHRGACVDTDGWSDYVWGGFFCGCGLALVKLSEETQGLRRDKENSDGFVGALKGRLALIEEGRLQDLPAEELAKITGGKRLPGWQMGGGETTYAASGDPLTFTSEGAGIVGRTNDSNGTVVFRGTIYNGSNWTVTNLTFDVVAKENDGTIRWARQVSTRFGENPELAPSVGDNLFVWVPDAEGIGSSEWSIVKARGYKLE